MQTYLVQARLGEQFEDLYVSASSPAHAVEIAKALTTLRHRFTTFVL